MQAECTIATIDFSIIQKNLEHSDNSTKKRKRRAFLRNQTLREIPETLYSFFEDLSSGKVCSGIGCGRGIHTISPPSYNLRDFLTSVMNNVQPLPLDCINMVTITMIET